MKFLIFHHCPQIKMGCCFGFLLWMAADSGILWDLVCLSHVHHLLCQVCVLTSRFVWEAWMQPDLTKHIRWCLLIFLIVTSMLSWLMIVHFRMMQEPYRYHWGLEGWETSARLHISKSAAPFYSAFDSCSSCIFSEVQLVFNVLCCQMHSNPLSLVQYRAPF